MAVVYHRACLFDWTTKYLQPNNEQQHVKQEVAKAAWVGVWLTGSVFSPESEQ